MNLDQAGGHVLAERAGDIEEGSFGAIPLKQVVIRMTEAQIKDTNDKRGKYIEAEFVVCEENGSYVGRKIWHNFNYVNPSEQAQRIGIAQLKSFCRVTRGELGADEQFTLSHVVDGMHKPFIASIKIDRYQNQRTGLTDERNVITAFKAPFDPYAQAQPQQGQMQQGQMQQGQMQQGQQPTPSWRK